MRPFAITALVAVTALTGHSQAVAEPKVQPMPMPMTIKPKIIAMPMVDVGSQTLSQPLKTTTYVWAKGNAPLRLPLAETHICVVTRITGKFAGYGERVALKIDTGATGGARWLLEGASGQPDMLIEATCAEKQQFVAERVMRINMDAKVSGPVNSSLCEARMSALKDGPNRAYFLSGIAGKFQGDGEGVSLASPDNNGLMTTQACSGAVEGWAVSFAIAGKVPKYRMKDKLTTDWKIATYALASTLEDKSSFLDFLGGGEAFTAPNEQQAFLAPVDEALCGLTGLKGKLQGYGEDAAIRQVTGTDGRKWWMLYVNTSAKGQTLSIAARCLARDQR